MTHLTDRQAVAVALNEGDAPWRAHVESCHACERRVADLREILHVVRRTEIPEPSPLFWTSLSTRIAEAIDAPQPRRTWVGMPWLAWTAAAALIVVAVTMFAIRVSDRSPTDVTPSEAVAPIATYEQSEEGPIGALSGPEPDEAWELVRSVATELDYDDVREAGIAPRPGAIERAALELDDDARAELVRLLQDEMKRSGV